MANEIVGRPMEILLVEDDLEDAGITIDTLQQGHVPCRISLVRNGEEALEFMRHQGHYARAPRPDLILLDLQMPRKGGREVLTEIRADRELSSIPVVVMTSSLAQRDLVEAEKLRVEDYLVKPFDRNQFVSLIKSLRKFLLADVLMP